MISQLNRRRIKRTIRRHMSSFTGLKIKIRQPSSRHVQAGLNSLFSNLNSTPSQLSRIFTSVHNRRRRQSHKVIRYTRAKVKPVHVRTNHPIRHISTNITNSRSTFNISPLPSRVHLINQHQDRVRHNRPKSRLPIRFLQGQQRSIANTRANFSVSRQGFTSSKYRYNERNQHHIPIRRHRNQVHATQILDNARRSQSITPFHTTTRVNRRLVRNVRTVTRRAISNIIHPTSLRISIKNSTYYLGSKRSRIHVLPNIRRRELRRAQLPRHLRSKRRLSHLKSNPRSSRTSGPILY